MRNSELKREMQKKEESTTRKELTGKTRVCERMGKTIKELICRMSPWKKCHVALREGHTKNRMKSVVPNTGTTDF